MTKHTLMKLLKSYTNGHLQLITVWINSRWQPKHINTSKHKHGFSSVNLTEITLKFEAAVSHSRSQHFDHDSLGYCMRLHIENTTFIENFFYFSKIRWSWPENLPKMQWKTYIPSRNACLSCFLIFCERRSGMWGCPRSWAADVLELWSCPQCWNWSHRQQTF